MKNRGGFTLVEIVLVIVVAAIAFPPVVLLFTESVRGRANAQLMGTASRLAEDLMEEISTRKWDETSPSRGGRTSTPSPTLGPDTGEARASYDDIDDYAAITSQSPPRDAADNVMGGLSGYSRSVAVEYVDDSLSPAGGPTDHKRVTVTVSCGAGSVELTTIRSNY